MFLPSCTVTNTTMLLYHKDFSFVRRIELMQSGLEYRSPAYIVPIRSRLHCAASVQCIHLRVTVCTAVGSVAVPVGLPLQA